MYLVYQLHVYDYFVLLYDDNGVFTLCFRRTINCDLNINPLYVPKDISSLIDDWKKRIIICKIHIIDNNMYKR